MDKQKEYLEAITAGRRALSCLRKAREQLVSAGNWGVADLIGGGFLTTMMKHSKIDNAASYMKNAKEQLHIFQRELKDILVPTSFELEISDFLTFSDYFFDGFISDYLVQSRISESKRQVEEAIRRVEHIIYELEHTIPMM